MNTERLVKERLNSWKEIARYLGRDVRTAIRWEQTKGLPIRRVPGGERQAVFAYEHEIDDWLNQSDGTGFARPADAPPITRPELSRETKPEIHDRSRSKYRISIILGALIVAIAAGLGIDRILHVAASIVSTRRLTSDGTYKLGVVSDGTEVYFGERNEGRIVLSSVSIKGGPVQRIQTGLADTVPVDISPDGKEILAVVSDGMEAEKLLWILPLSGTPRPANGIRCHDAAWSPNRSRSIAYATGNDIFLTSDEGKSSTKLGTFPPYPTQIAWSADGSQLRFLTYDSGTEVLKPLSMRLRQDSKGSPVVKLSLPKECCNSWSKFPYGPFFFATSPNSSEVWVSREDNLRNQSPIRLALDALQAPLIVATAGFDSKFLVMSPAQQIFELLRFSVKTRDFAPFAHTLQGSYVDFSPDGKRMAYARISDHALFVSTADGQQPRQLTFGPMVVELPRWSPDGRQIAFTAKLPDRPWRIFIVSQAGGVPYEASSGSDDQGAPTWSPDGRSLIYANIECHESSRCGVHRIELGKKTVEDLPRSAGFRTARWSPDGKFVAALRADTHGLWLFDFKKNDWSQVADDANEDDISWSRDSRFIYYSRSNANGKSIARLSLHTKQKETALDLSAFNSINGDFSSWFCLTPENSIIILRQLEASEIYAVDWVQR